MVNIFSETINIYSCFLQINRLWNSSPSDSFELTCLQVWKLAMNKTIKRFWTPGQSKFSCCKKQTCIYFICCGQKPEIYKQDNFSLQNITHSIFHRVEKSFGKPVEFHLHIYISFILHIILIEAAVS